MYLESQLTNPIMKNNASRRVFLRNTLFATSGVALLSSPLHAFSNSTCPFEGYNPFAEQKTDLRSSGFFGQHVIVQGTVYDSVGNQPLTNASIEIWHLSPNSNKFRHRGKMLTNNLGEYKFLTDYPNKEIGKNARIYFKISGATDSYFTELVLNQSGAYVSSDHWSRNNQLGKEMFPKKETFLNQTSIQFNLSI